MSLVTTLASPAHCPSLLEWTQKHVRFGAVLTNLSLSRNPTPSLNPSSFIASHLAIAPPHPSFSRSDRTSIHTFLITSPTAAHLTIPYELFSPAFALCGCTRIWSFPCSSKVAKLERETERETDRERERRGYVNVCVCACVFMSE